MVSDRESGFRFSPTRRALLMAGGGLAAASLLGQAAPVLAQRKKDVQAQVPLDELMKPGPLPELTMGKSDAPVKVVEYASMTCGHCAHFHNEVFAGFKQKYIDSGKVYFVMREFPLDNLAAAASIVARCAGDDKTFPLISALFEKQEQWAFVRGNPVPELFKIAKQAGFTQESFDKCLNDPKLLDDVKAVRARASEKFGVNATPTFFINGKRLDDAPTMAAFDKAIEPMLKS
jgi:protein-disulfide isomerase